MAGAVLAPYTVARFSLRLPGSSGGRLHRCVLVGHRLRATSREWSSDVDLVRSEGNNDGSITFVFGTKEEAEEERRRIQELKHEELPPPLDHSTPPDEAASAQTETTSQQGRVLVQSTPVLQGTPETSTDAQPQEGALTDKAGGRSVAISWPQGGAWAEGGPAGDVAEGTADVAGAAADVAGASQAVAGTKLEEAAGAVAELAEESADVAEAGQAAAASQPQVISVGQSEATDMMVSDPIPAVPEPQETALPETGTSIYAKEGSESLGVSGQVESPETEGGPSVDSTKAIQSAIGSLGQEAAGAGTGAAFDLGKAPGPLQGEESSSGGTAATGLTEAAGQLQAVESSSRSAEETGNAPAKPAAKRGRKAKTAAAAASSAASPGPSTDAPPTPKAKGARIGKGKKALSLNGAAPSAAPATVAEAGKSEDNGAEIAADSDGAAPTAGDVPLEHAPGRVESADVKARLQSMKLAELRDVCRKNKISGFSNLPKADLLNMLLEQANVLQEV